MSHRWLRLHSRKNFLFPHTPCVYPPQLLLPRDPVQRQPRAWPAPSAPPTSPLRPQAAAPPLPLPPPPSQQATRAASFDYETPVSTSTILELLASEAEAEAPGEGEEVTDRDHTSHQEYQYMLGQELEPSLTDSQPLFLSLPLRSSHRPSQTPRTPPTPIPQRRRIDGHDYDYTNVESMYIPMPSVMRQVSSLIDSQARAGSRDDLDLDLAIHPSSRHHHSKHTFGYGSGSYSGSRSGSASDLSAWAKAKGATTSTSGSDLSSLVLDDHGALFDLDLETS